MKEKVELLEIEVTNNKTIRTTEFDSKKFKNSNAGKNGVGKSRIIDELKWGIEYEK